MSEKFINSSHLFLFAEKAFNKIIAYAHADAIRKTVPSVFLLTPPPDNPKRICIDVGYKLINQISKRF